jgi:hypothetical protein
MLALFGLKVLFFAWMLTWSSFFFCRIASG